MSSISLTYAALKAGASSDWLNPPPDGHYHPLRYTARLVYAIACTILMPIPGVFYHGAVATYNAVWLNNSDAAEKHVVAAIQDVLAAAFLAPYIFMRFKGRDLDCQVDPNCNWRYEYKESLAGAIAFAIPLAFATAPDRFKE